MMKRKPARKKQPKRRAKPVRAFPQRLGDAILARALVAGVGSR